MYQYIWLACYTIQKGAKKWQRYLVNMWGGISYPDYSNVIKSGFNAGDSYTASADGWIVGFMNYAATQSASSKVNVNGRLVAAVWANNVAMYGPVMCPIKRGDVITTDAQGVYTNLTFIGKRY